MKIQGYVSRSKLDREEENEKREIDEEIANKSQQIHGETSGPLAEDLAELAHFESKKKANKEKRDKKRAERQHQIEVFAGRLQVALTHQNKNQAALAKAVDVAQPSASAWIQGKKYKDGTITYVMPTHEKVMEMAAFLDVDINWLYLGKGRAPFSKGEVTPDSEPTTTEGVAAKGAVGDVEIWHDEVIQEGNELSKAWETVSMVQDKGIPIDIGQIIKSLGIRVKMVQGSDTFSGSIASENDRYVITVNNRHHPNRKRFTVAHELAHFLTHRHLIGDGITDDAMYRSGLPSNIEREANRVAAEILMPNKAIDQLYIEYNGEVNLADWAVKLGVSEQALSIRLGNPY